jgi:hypothetical protein
MKFADDDFKFSPRKSKSHMDVVLLFRRVILNTNIISLIWYSKTMDVNTVLPIANAYSIAFIFFV